MASRGTQQGSQKAQDEATAALGFLEALPEDGSPEVMVPLGRVAFVPGRLVDTQRCELHMGKPFCIPNAVLGLLSIHSETLAGLATSGSTHAYTHAGPGTSIDCSREQAMSILRQRRDAVLERHSQAAQEVQVCACRPECMRPALSKRCLRGMACHRPHDVLSAIGRADG